MSVSGRILCLLVCYPSWCTMALRCPVWAARIFTFRLRHPGLSSCHNSQILTILWLTPPWWNVEICWNFAFSCIFCTWHFFVDVGSESLGAKLMQKVMSKIDSCSSELMHPVHIAGTAPRQTDSERVPRHKCRANRIVTSTCRVEFDDSHVRCAKMFTPTHTTTCAAMFYILTIIK